MNIMFFFVEEKTTEGVVRGLVGSEKCIKDKDSISLDATETKKKKKKSVCLCVCVCARSHFGSRLMYALPHGGAASGWPKASPL